MMHLYDYVPEEDNYPKEALKPDVPIAGSIMFEGYYIARVWSDVKGGKKAGHANGRLIAEALNAYTRDTRRSKGGKK